MIGPCPVCGERERLRPLKRYRNIGRRVMPDEKELLLAGCERCGLGYTLPRPTEEQLEVFYGTPEGWEARQDEGERSEHELRAKLDKVLETKHRRRSAEFERLWRDVPRLRDPGVALDFGCGLGGNLDVLQDLGWETWGIEPGPRQQAIAGERHRMIEAPPDGETFDLVVLNHVIEHLRNPVDVLRSLAAATKPGGVIFVSVPDFGRLGVHGRFKYIADERHICSWTAPGLSSALGLAGWRTVAHPDWDDLTEEESWRLKLVGEKMGERIEPHGSPLAAAVKAVTLYEQHEERFEREKRERRAARRQAKAAEAAAASRPRGGRLVSAVRSRLGL